MLVASLLHMRILLPVVAALVPLLISPHVLFYFDVTPKILALVFGASLALIFFIFDRGPMDNLLASRAGRWFCLLIGAEAISITISTILSTNSALSLHGGTWRRFGTITQASILILVLLTAAWLSRDREGLKPLLRVMAAIGGLIALYGIFQYFGIDPFLPAAGYHEGEGKWMIVRPPGTLGQATYFAAYLLVPVFAGIAVYAGEQRLFWKASGAAASVLGALAIVLSGTRSAMAGLIVGGVVMAIWTRARMRVSHVVTAACVFAGLIGFYYSPGGGRLRARMKWSFDDARGGARLPLWRDSLRMAAQRPWAGYGPESFASEFPRFQSVELAQAYPDFYHESPHNIFLDALTSQGVFGLSIALAFAGLGFYAAALRAHLGAEEPARVAPIVGSCLAAVLVAQLFMAFTAPNALYFGLLVAILAALAPRDAGAGHRVRIARLPMAAVGVCLAAVFALFGMHLLFADYYMSRVRADLENLNGSAAIQDYGRVLAWHTAGFSADLYYSQKMAELASKSPGKPDRLRYFEEALAAGLRATQTSEDRQNAWYNLAALYASGNNAAAVEQSLRASIASAPNWFKPHWILAQVLRARGKLDEAEAQAKFAAVLDNGKDREVNQTLYEIQAQRQTRGQ